MDLVVISISVWHGINVLYYIILDEERNAKFVRLNKCVRVLYWALPKCCSINDDCDDDNRAYRKKDCQLHSIRQKALTQSISCTANDGKN